MRLVFMGTPDFSVPALDALIAAGHEILAVYTQPPRPAKRGMALTKSAVHQAAEAHGLPVRHPATFKEAAVQQEFADLKPDAAVVVAYGLILPTSVLEAPPLGCWNIHASLLPRWRGAAPIHRAILAGDGQSGVTIMAMEEGLDTGAMLVRDTVPIDGATTAQSLHDTLSTMGGRLIVAAMDMLAAGPVTPTPQPEDGVTYAKKLEKLEGLIDWSETAAEIARKVRGLSPWPGSFFQLGKDRIKVLDALASPDTAKDTAQDSTEAAPGTVLTQDGKVACGTGSLTLIRAQRPGKGPVTGAELIRGLRLSDGTVLG